MPQKTGERRGSSRVASRLDVWVVPEGDARRLAARVVDVSAEGLAIELDLALEAGTLVTIAGDVGGGFSRRSVSASARVCWCEAVARTLFMAGLRLAEPALGNPFHEPRRAAQTTTTPSPMPTPPPAAGESSETDRQASRGVEAERRKRRGVLEALYQKRLRLPKQPALSVSELEDLLACGREHLEFTLWYLKEKNWVQRTDGGHYSITVAGVDQVEVDLEEQSAPGKA